MSHEKSHIKTIVGFKITELTSKIQVPHTVQEMKNGLNLFRVYFPCFLPYAPRLYSIIPSIVCIGDLLNHLKIQWSPYVAAHPFYYISYTLSFGIIGAISMRQSTIYGCLFTKEIRKCILWLSFLIQTSGWRGNLTKKNLRNNVEKQRYLSDWVNLILI